MGYDQEGTFNWNTFWKGASIALVGITAITSVVTAGCAAPVLAAVIAIASGMACIGFGVAINKATNPNMVCFIEGTLVLSAEWCVPIEHIKPGDYVVATDLILKKQC